MTDAVPELNESVIDLAERLYEAYEKNRLMTIMVLMEDFAIPKTWAETALDKIESKPSKRKRKKR